MKTWLANFIESEEPNPTQEKRWKRYLDHYTPPRAQEKEKQKIPLGGNAIPSNYIASTSTPPEQTIKDKEQEELDEEWEDDDDLEWWLE